MVMNYPLRDHWQRYRPRRKPHYKHRDRRHDRPYLLPKETPEFMCVDTDLFDCAEQQVVAMLQRRPEVHDLDKDIVSLHKKFVQSKEPMDGLIALLAQAPRAVLAQIQMEKHPHGYHNKRERLFELIDFNDTLVSTVLVLDDEHRAAFSERAKLACDRVCKRVGAPCYSNEQWAAIIRGLSREVAVYLAAQHSGFDAYMTDRVSDALGIDMQIRDPESGRYVNIDCKSPSSFRHRLEHLIHEHRLTSRELLIADERHYAVEFNGPGRHKTPIIVLCVLPDAFGDIEHFRFLDEAAIHAMLNRLIRDHGLADRHFGPKYA